jgi:hypothetical protein
MPVGLMALSSSSWTPSSVVALSWQSRGGGQQSNGWALEDTDAGYARYCVN